VNSRYLNVLRIASFLVGDVSPDGRFGNGANAAHVVAPRPESRHARFEPREFFSQFVGREALELSGNVRRSQPRVGFNEHVNVIGHNFQSVNLSGQFLRLLVQKFSQAFLHGSEEHLQSVLGAPNQVILERVDRPETDAISGINHEPNVAQPLEIRKRLNKQDHNPLPAEASSSLRF